jgi:hypothetical protein
MYIGGIRRRASMVVPAVMGSLLLKEKVADFYRKSSRRFASSKIYMKRDDCVTKKSIRTKATISEPSVDYTPSTGDPGWGLR